MKPISFVIITYNRVADTLELLQNISGLAGAETLLQDVVVVNNASVDDYTSAYVVQGVCVLRYDNEAGKGDHRHYAGKEFACSFRTAEKLLADFQRDIARWIDENSDT